MTPAKTWLMLAGAIIALIGVVAIVVPSFTTGETHDVAKIGDLKLTAKEETTHIVPPFVGPVVLGVGVLLMGAGILARR